MNVINNDERKAEDSVRQGKALNILKKILLYTVAAISVVVVLAVLYQVLEFLFVGAILFFEWICPKRWWW